MSKHMLVAMAGFLCLAGSASAQEMQAPELRAAPRLTLAEPGSSNAWDGRVALVQAASFAALNSVYYGPAPLRLADGRLFSFAGAFGWVEATPVDFLPALLAAEPLLATAGATPAREHSAGLASFLPKFDYASGEVGFLYGKSTGKFGREIEQGYILGEIGNENTQITVGASYGKSSGSFPGLNR
ncbi:MAG: hypothetical protein ACREIF_17045 [Chthoniobacterales bacterium]